MLLVPTYINLRGPFPKACSTKLSVPTHGKRKKSAPALIPSCCIYIATAAGMGVGRHTVSVGELCSLLNKELCSLPLLCLHKSVDSKSPIHEVEGLLGFLSPQVFPDSTYCQKGLAVPHTLTPPLRFLGQDIKPFECPLSRYLKRSPLTWPMSTFLSFLTTLAR